MNDNFYFRWRLPLESTVGTWPYDIKKEIAMKIGPMGMSDAHVIEWEMAIYLSVMNDVLDAVEDKMFVFGDGTVRHSSSQHIRRFGRMMVDFNRRFPNSQRRNN